jgi:hypothetical protein
MSFTVGNLSVSLIPSYITGSLFLVTFIVFFTYLYLITTKLRTLTISKAEALVFHPGHAPTRLHNDAECLTKQIMTAEAGSKTSTNEVLHLLKQTDNLS